MPEVGELYVKITARMDELERQLKKVETDTPKRMQKMAEKSGQELLKTFGDYANKAGNALTVGLTLPIVALGKKAFDAAVGIEKMELGMTAIMGSAKAAKNEIENLRVAAQKPGLGFQEAVGASMKLQGIGLSAKEARQQIEAFANANARVGGSKENFNEILRQWGQMQSLGKVTAENLNIVAERLPGFYKVMKEKFNTANTEIVQDAIKNGRLTMAQFVAGMTDGLAGLPGVMDSTQNQLDNLSDMAQQSFAEIGKDLIPIAKEYLPKVTKAIHDLVEEWKKLNPDQKEGMFKWAAAFAVSGPLMKGLSGAASMLGGMVKSAKWLNDNLVGIKAPSWMTNAGGAGAGTGGGALAGIATGAPLAAIATTVGSVAAGSYAAYRTFWGDLQDQRGSIAGKDTESQLSAMREKAFQDLKSKLSSELSTSKDSKSAIANILGISGIGGPWAGGKDEVKQILERLAWSLDPKNQVSKGGFFYGMQDTIKKKGSGMVVDLGGQSGKNGAKEVASVRSNNPGAMWPGPISKQFGSDGYESLNDGLGQDNKIAKFSSVIDGAAAQFALLASSRYAGRSLRAMIQKWSGGNNVPSYMAMIKKGTGLTGSEFIDKNFLASPAGIELVKTMAHHEAGRAYPMPKGGWEMAQKVWLSGKPSFIGAPREGDSYWTEEQEKAAKKAQEVKEANAEQWKKYTDELKSSTKGITDFRNKMSGMLSRIAGGFGFGATGSLNDQISIEKFGKPFASLNSQISRNEVMGEYWNRWEQNRADDARWKSSTSMDRARDFFRQWNTNNRNSMDRWKDAEEQRKDDSRQWDRHKDSWRKVFNLAGKEGARLDREALKEYADQMKSLDERMIKVSGSSSVASMRLKGLTDAFLMGRKGPEAFAEATTRAKEVLEYEAKVLKAEQWKQIGDQLAREMTEPLKTAFQDLVRLDFPDLLSDLGNLLDNIARTIASRQIELAVQNGLGDLIGGAIGGLFSGGKSRPSVVPSGFISGANPGEVIGPDGMVLSSNKMTSNMPVNIVINATDAASVIQSKDQIAYELSQEMSRVQRMR